MLAQINHKLGHLLGRLHRDQEGAVMFAAFAACCMIFMLAMVLYDAGKNVRDKSNLQNAADVAAYSQAAVKARSMNMIAFTNIGKRTIIGLHNTYWGMYLGYSAWVASECASCCCSWTCWGCFRCDCRNCWGNTPVVLYEGFTDWMTFSGFPFPMPFIFGGESRSVFAKELEALQDYQDYMVEVTPWWGFSEQLIRGARNGATVTASFPPPPDALTVGIDMFEQILNFINAFAGTGFAIWPQTQLTDGLPIERDDSILGRIESCSPPMPMLSIMTLGSIAEVGVNIAHHRNRSMGTPPIACQGPKGAKPIAMGSASAVGMCFMAAILSPISDYMAPYHLTNSQWSILPWTGSLPDSAEDLMARSNVVFAYRYDPENQNMGKRRLSFMPAEYSAAISTTGTRNTNPVLGASGLWSFSRAELIHPNRAWGSGPNDTWMWHPGWTAKLRPLALKNEFTQLGGQISYNGNSALNAMYHDVLPYLAGGFVILQAVNALVGGESFNIQQAARDFYFMEKATRTMDDRSTSGQPQ